MRVSIPSSIRHGSGTVGTPSIRTFGPVEGVELLHWPDDAIRREELRRAGRPRLLLMAAEARPPTDVDADEDWAWLPIDERDLFVRLRRLVAARPTGVEADLDSLVVDGDGVLRGAARLLPLPPIEAALVRTLLTSPLGPRSRDELAHAAWGEATRAGRSLDSRILTLRRRLAPLGLAVTVVRGRGFVLRALPPEASAR